MSIKLLTVSRLEDGLVLASYRAKDKGAECEETVDRVLRSGNIQPNSQITVVINDDIGTLHLLAGTIDVLSAVTNATYPRRSAFQLLKDARDAVVNNVAPGEITGTSERGALSRTCKPWLKQLSEKYSVLASVDKITAVGAKVDEVRLVMEGNINRVLDNAENLSNVEDKAENLRQNAQQFQRKSESLRKVLWWRNLKMKLIVLLLVLSIVGYFVVPMLVKMHQGDSDDDRDQEFPPGYWQPRWPPASPAYPAVNSPPPSDVSPPLAVNSPPPSNISPPPSDVLPLPSDISPP
mmetsp:Transcript_39223/g.65916  ORF Transcript_39223/g.65916 Transcript_39223/m.65916 type:complete len:293 (-) Transcript_39223:113-991(-)